ncbi:MAG: hypothetical protein ABI566_10835 [Pseudolysinimonas sp.]
MSRVSAVLATLAAVAIVLAGCAPVPNGMDRWPTAMVVLGHSGATGFNSDPDKPNQDAKENSWATGTNKDVLSVYQRAVVQSPALSGHAYNEAVSGSNVHDLPAQVDAALAEDRLPDLFLIQTIDNDIRCDGTDDDNYDAYGEKIAAVLASIHVGAPDARIYVAGLWGDVQNFTDVISLRPDIVAANQGGGPCDVFDSDGEQLPEVIANYQGIVDEYENQLRDACDAVDGCIFGGDDVLNMQLTPDDLAPDTNYLSIRGLHKLADIVWTALSAA